MTASNGRRPGYHVRASFPGAEASERPIMAYLGQMLKKYWEVRVVTMISQGSMIVEFIDRGDDGLSYCPVWWTITDNGGEIHMRRINDASVPPPDAPYSQSVARVPIGRLAWFVAMTIRGEEIEGYGANDAVDELVLLDDEVP